MSSGALLCTDGAVTIAGDGAPLCSGHWSLAPVPEPFAISETLIAQSAEAFGLGFGLVFTCWAMAYGFRAVLSLIR
jgi:hypothetical protein